MLHVNSNETKQNTKVLSLIQQTQQGSSCTLDRTAGNMVLQSFDLGLNGGDNLPPYAGDYAPSAGFYTDLDTAIYSQGKVTQMICNLSRICF